MPRTAHLRSVAPAALAAFLCISPAAADEPVPRPTAAELWKRQADNADQIRAGRRQMEDDWTARRYSLIDEALAHNAALLELAAADPGLAAVARSLRQDRLVALVARGAGSEAWDQVALLEAGGEALPPYALQAAGDAAMLVRRPRDAMRYYQHSLATQPGDRSLRVALAYAQLEAEDFDALDRNLEEIERAAPDDAGTRRLLAQFARFADRPQQAQAQLRAAQRLAPDDAGNDLEAAALDAMHGHPRAAAARYARVLALAPDNLRARIGLAESAHAVGDFAAASGGVAEVTALAPEHPAVRRLAEDDAAARRAQLVAEVTAGRGSGAITGNDDITHDVWLYSPRLGDAVRVFGHHHRAAASFDDNDAAHARGAVGVELTRADWQARLEAGRETTNARSTGVAASLAWQADDHWSFRLLHETRTDDLPLKGRWRPDDGDPFLNARRSVAGLAYRVDESRRIAADWSHYRFSDGNLRNALSATWFERLASRTRHTLDLQAALYASHNTLGDRVYFNPRNDLAISATLSSDWLLWREYDRRFNHRLAVTLGGYRQQGFEEDYGWNAFHDLRYEHEWGLGRDLSLRYGVGTRQFPYDGEHERKNYLYAHIDWRF
ncbi:poly-beta-1,6 N-acetyl-D-glucosamine export porin PgaA [Thauera sinica]|uniref:Poly-beta-1,6 N-acetyl-D-glucosamine export porin PgaA n=1 Tax=Thauera sinica TaxID=2665146 RepID=A0ABW1ASP3_9RHOO|nr:poly-beta-1,6 N-acetyl-D-glucosamine export porin PgaA [Thauera sp. K11]ATE61460.1 poly-beta-1,6 N-acetyl-D-glucosamine export porin PgaA [Thauera sp. K11]